MVDKITHKQNKSSHVCTMQYSFLNPNPAMTIGSNLFHLGSLNELTKCWISHSVIMPYNLLMLMIVVDMFQSNFIYSPAKKVIRTVISKVSSLQALCVWVRWFHCVFLAFSPLIIDSNFKSSKDRKFNANSSNHIWVVYPLKRRTQLPIINYKGNQQDSLNMKIMIWLI